MNENWKKDISNATETYWENNKLKRYRDIKDSLCFSDEDIDDSRRRLERFAPFIQKVFPETREQNGIIESPLKEISATKSRLNETYSGYVPQGRLLLKCDSHLAIAGSVKARGGIYEVLKHTEELAIQHGILRPEDDYAKLTDYKDFFSKYSVQVGSTGNLGMSIGIMSAAIGYRAIVHMSKDAKEWKKELLRKNGVIVKEYDSDYSKAVLEGRKESEADSYSYFVDDEHSRDLFLGYAVAGERLKKQLIKKQIDVDEKHPLCVYIPCGVGGAPGGITFGLKSIWGDSVHCFFVEPTQAPCMFVGMASGKKNAVCVQDYGLSGKTQADGLAVGRCSGLAATVMENMLGGIFTVEDQKLYQYMKILYEADNIVIEPSACAAFKGYLNMGEKGLASAYFNKLQTEEATHIIWATGGSLMPQTLIEGYLKN